MKNLLLLLLVFNSKVFNETTVRPITINVQPKTFLYGKDLSSHILVLFTQIGPNLSNEPGVVLIKSVLLELKRTSPFLKSIDNSLTKNERMETSGVALSSDEFVVYSEFTNDTPVSNTSETESVV